MGDAGGFDTSQYNMRSPGVKRLMKEAQELRNPTDMYYAQPLDDNLFEWHFTVRGPADTDFDGGIYHGRIILPVDYPMKPPSVILLTPNGRFQLNQKICLSISGYHPESWRPSWSIRTALLALIGFMPTQSAGALGALEYPPAERKRLALLSQKWVCKECGLRMCDALAKEPSTENAKEAEEARKLAQQIVLDEVTATKEAKKNGEDSAVDVKEPSDVIERSAVVAGKENSGGEYLKIEEQPESSAGGLETREMNGNVPLVNSQNIVPDTASSGIPVLAMSSTVNRRASLTVSGSSPPVFSWHLVIIAVLLGIVCALLYRRLVNAGV